jgi:HEAT repeat protein
MKKNSLIATVVSTLFYVFFIAAPTGSAQTAQTASPAKESKESQTGKAGTKTTPANSSVPQLLRQLRSENLKEHFGAASGLVKAGKSAVPGVVKLICDERWYVGLTAIWVLGEIRDPAALEPLVEALQSKETIGPPGYSSYVGNMTYRPQTALALYESPNSFPSWNLLLKRRAAAIALGNLGDKRAVEPLQKVLAEGPFSHGAEANVAIAKAIKKLTGQPLPEEIENGLEAFSEYK